MTAWTGRRLLALLALASAALVGGCASNATRELTDRELQAFQRLEQRLAQNRPALTGALEDLEALSADALLVRHTLTLDLSSAQLLASMKSPWLESDAERTTTEQEVALYRLYALAEAQRELLDVHLRERRAALDEVAVAYGRLSSLIEQAITAQKLVLAELHRPRSAAVASSVNALLTESRAFREHLTTSDHPELRALAAEVAVAEQAVATLQWAIVEAVAATEGSDAGEDTP